MLGAGKKVSNIMTGGEWNFPSVLPYAVYYVKTGSDQIGQHLLNGLFSNIVLGMCGYIMAKAMLTFFSSI